jgi:hypothetical protein
MNILNDLLNSPDIQLNKNLGSRLNKWNGFQ